ncbi:MAG: hypothetical protein SW833_21525 [Cyanobacteriota bacterium]|nr:hypothetical protein [Cyanobacteriota bacterium]
MFNKLFKTISDFCQVQIPNPSPKIVLGILTIAGVAVANATPAMATEPSLKDGIYLYGQSPTAETLGAEYLVFEVKSGSLQGAFYMPSSEFSCVTGNVTPQNLSLSVVGPYEEEASPYAIALATQESVAGTNASAPVGLEGYHRLDTPSRNDLRMLEVCQSRNP